MKRADGKLPNAVGNDNLAEVIDNLADGIDNRAEVIDNRAVGELPNGRSNTP